MLYQQYFSHVTTVFEVIPLFSSHTITPCEVIPLYRTKALSTEAAGIPSLIHSTSTKIVVTGCPARVIHTGVRVCEHCKKLDPISTKESSLCH